jgi:uncharacterized membrane protein
MQVCFRYEHGMGVRFVWNGVRFSWISLGVLLVGSCEMVLSWKTRMKRKAGVRFTQSTHDTSELLTADYMC